MRRWLARLAVRVCGFRRVCEAMMERYERSWLDVAEDHRPDDCRVGLVREVVWWMLGRDGLGVIAAVREVGRTPTVEVERAVIAAATKHAEGDGGR